MSFGKELCRQLIESFDGENSEWAFELNDGFDWWPKDRRVSIRFTNVEDDDGQGKVLVSLFTDVVKDLDLEDSALNAINQLSQNGSLSGFVYFEESRKLRLASSIAFSSGIYFPLFSRLRTTAVLQYREAEIAAESLVESIGSSNDISDHPQKDSRQVPSSLVEIFQETVLPPGPAKPEDVGSALDYFTDINQNLDDLGWSLMTNFGASGLTTEFPWGKGFSSLTTFIITTHPIFGQGVQIRQQFPIRVAPIKFEHDDRIAALKLSFLELVDSDPNFPLSFGGYSWNQTMNTIQWSSFLPMFTIKSGVDHEDRKVLNQKLVVTLARRANLISLMFTDENWEKKSVSPKQSSIGKAHDLFQALGGRKKDQDSFVEFLVDSMMKDIEETTEGLYGFDKDEMGSTHGGNPSNDSMDKRGGETDDDTMKNDIGMEFSWIPAGSFMMGSPASESYRDSNEGPQRLVTIAQGFWMGRHQVTQGQYEAVMGANLSHFETCGKDCPVENVSWEDAKVFISRLNAHNDGFVYSLPTEAEWEYAARAGTTTAFAFGNSLSSTQANFNGNYPYGNAPKGPFLERTTKVGSYDANAWGLYDMHGNVMEWVEDIYQDSYTGLPTDGSANTTRGDTSLRVLRGGSWRYRGYFSRSAFRESDSPEGRYRSNGFRVVARAR